ncbi:farnesyl-diphosphate farnesyltransferase [Eremomyces bilateralis CBS 781.70]|uniref:Squalene synthase n=1 Tax=Eremomyces bilateralis CBS 781.70 TaxID=1392243 RepID=A0A6G1FXD7_9PEZI|nr:farnesyl-diphosphate farnesyltransferase [Eremomyces bilateralis CBS 781.70]KAF1810497.1 farnesyl-diphosphate farnesyltransferase [Eremomyces bilateralis CBS 781.70]
MPKLSTIIYYLFHIPELRAIIQWKIWHDAPHERDPDKESESLRQCFYYLDKTSRSFAAVIKELNPELLSPICLFYLILRGLDTIEDDMTIALSEKEPLLRDFDSILEKDGWSYDGNHAKEKDRELLVNFHVVITEFKNIKPTYRSIIKDITKKMGNGMADYANNAEHNINGVNTVKEYELYCHYVAGLVGEGLTRLFVESKLANPALLERAPLQESMGQFLQQTNIIRDIREDWDDKRRFWPKEIWSKHVANFEDLFKPEHQVAALNCSSEMILLALERADECLLYLAGLREQSVFNFAAIPQAMAIATLELCFRNPDMFKRNIKITKGQACQLMMESTQNLQILYGAFRAHVRKIHTRNDPKDPNFLKISVACGKIEQFIENVFPSQVPQAKVGALGGKTITAEDAAKAKADAAEARWDSIYMLSAVCLTLFLVTVFMVGTAWLSGARFDIVFNDLWNGKFFPKSSTTVSAKQEL